MSVHTSPSAATRRDSQSPTTLATRLSSGRNATFTDNVASLPIDVQLKHVTNESQRKDLLVLDLRKQVSELLRYREQASNLKAQVTLAEEREKLRESEANTKNTELIGRVRSLEEIEANLRRQVIRLEEEKAEILRKASHQHSDIHAQLAALRADAERRELVRQKLEYELTLSSKAAQQNLERERAERALTEKLAQLSSEKVEYTRVNQRLHEANARLESEVRTLTALRDKDTLQFETLESDMDAFRATIKEQELELTTRRQEAVMIVSLQQENQIIPNLKGEINRLKNIIKESEDKYRLLEEEKARTVESMTQLQHQLNEYSRRSVEVVTLTGKLQDYKTKLELSESELERSRALSEKLRDQLTKTRARLDASATELHKIVSTTRNYFGASVPREESSRNAGGISTGDYFDSLWGEMHSLVARLCAENSQLEPARAMARHYEDQHAHLETVTASLEKEKLAMLSAIARLEAEINSHRTYMQTLCKDISQTYTTQLYNNVPIVNNPQNIWSNSDQNSISMMHVFLSERLAKLSSLNEAYHKNIEEKARALTEKTKELSDLQQKLAQDSEKERAKNNEQMQQVEQKYQSSESELAKLKESLQVAEQTALNIEARYKESLLRITQQNEDTDALFYAIEILVRLLHPLRVRYMEVIAQKRLLSRLLHDSHAIRHGVSVLAHAIQGTLDHDHSASPISYSPNARRKRHHVGMRTAVIAVIAAHRMIKFTYPEGQRPLSGVPIRIGRESFVLASPVILSNAKDVPHVERGDDLTALVTLIEHFDPPSRFEDAILDPRLLLALQSGLPRKIRGKGDLAVTVRGVSAEESLSVVRKTTLDIMRRLKESERERTELVAQSEHLGHEVGQLRADNASLDLALSHAQELCAILEDRVHHLQEEEVGAQNIRAEELKRSLQDQSQRVSSLSHSLSLLKTDLHSKDDTIDELRSDLIARDALLDSLRMDLESKEALLGTFKREMAAKDALLSDLKNDVRSKSELLSDMRTKDALVDTLKLMNGRDKKHTKK